MRTTLFSDNLNIGDTVALEKLDPYKKSIAQVEQAYLNNISLQNGFANIANEYCENGHYEVALKLYERDCLLNRLSPAYRHIYAYLLSQSNRIKEALSEISRACDEDPSLTYGYLLVDRLSGNVCFRKNRIDTVLKQDNNGKHCPSNLLNQAQCLAQWAQWAAAEIKTAEAYQCDFDLRDGYVLIGSIHRAFVHYDLALHYYEIDARLNRITPASRLIFAQLLAQSKRINEAENEVLHAYKEDDTLCDGYSLIGSVFRNKGRYQEALPYYEKDRNLARLSPANCHILADHLARSGRFEEAEQHVETGYIEDSSLRNGYARIGSILRAKSEFTKAFQYYERDWKDDHLSPVHRVVYAELLTRFGKLIEALNEINVAYAEYLTLTDGYGRCSWQYYWKRKQYENIIELCEFDQKKGRLSPAWEIILAQAYAANGNIDKSIETVNDAYDAEPTLIDGYARCAWQYYWPRSEFEKVIEFCELDNQKGRLSPKWMLNLAQAYTAIDEIEKAINLIEQAYKADSTLTDGYARCAWQFYWHRRSYQKLIVMIEKDKNMKRLSPNWLIFIGQAYSMTGDIDTAKKLVAEAYDIQPSLTDGYARCAWYYYYHFLKGNSLYSMIELMEKDLQSGKLSSFWTLNLARGYADKGSTEKAEPLIEKAYCDDRDLKDGYAKLAFSRYGRNFFSNIQWIERDLKLNRLSENFKNKFDSIKRATNLSQRLSYRLPAIVVSFPRSGSNFIQNVIQESSGMICQSIYDTDILLNGTLNLKTHSPSPEYFINEWIDSFKSEPLPEKLILLIRDPRDVFISFYEFVKFRRNIDVPQNDFLSQTDYFYAAFTDKRIYSDGLSICRAYKEFIQNWYVRDNKKYDILKVHYEDLVGNPAAAFLKIFKFLEIDCELSLPSLKKRVSLYSPSRRLRGAASGWESIQQEYSHLIMQSQIHFEEEMLITGYRKSNNQSRVK